MTLMSGRCRIIDQEHPRYRWIALGNTTLGVLMATVKASIVIISLPAIFHGIGLQPLQPGNVGYLLWMPMGYLLVSAVFVISFGRLGDQYGRVRIYNLGFVVFALSAIALSLDPFRAGAGRPGRSSSPADLRAVPRRARRGLRHRHRHARDRRGGVAGPRPPVRAPGALTVP